MPTDLFAYRGPASIGDQQFADVVLRERQEGHLRTWSGHTTSATAMDGQFMNTPTVTVGLPDGRTGTAHLSISFDGHRWTVELTGTGPAPGATG